MESIVILKVKRNKNNVNAWFIERCDSDPDVVGEITMCGVPHPARSCKLGATYKTIFKN